MPGLKREWIRKPLKLLSMVMGAAILARSLSITMV